MCCAYKHRTWDKDTKKNGKRNLNILVCIVYASSTHMDSQLKQGLACANASPMELNAHALPKPIHTNYTETEERKKEKEKEVHVVQLTANYILEKFSSEFLSRRLVISCFCPLLLPNNAAACTNPIGMPTARFWTMVHWFVDSSSQLHTNAAFHAWALLASFVANQRMHFACTKCSTNRLLTKMQANHVEPL